jgi:iron complex outermembrane receptor protein
MNHDPIRAGTRLLATTTLCLSPALVFAQAAVPPAAPASAPETTLAPVPVRASAERETATGPVPGYRARRSSTATKTDTPLNEVPQSISVIGAEQVRDQNSQTMQEVLRYSAGVRAELYGLDNRGDWISLRGGSNGTMLLDGLRQPMTGWWGDVRDEPYAFERIEVLRGPASVIAGQNGPGGVVNLVSKRPQAEPMREVAVQLGNFDHKQLAADLTGPLAADGSLLYRLVALGKDSGTQVNHADEQRTFLAPSLTWKPRAGTSLTVRAEVQKDESGNVNAFFPIEGTLRPAPNGYIPYDTFIGEPDWDRYGGTRKRFAWEFEQQLGSDWTLRHHFRRDRVEGGMRTMYAAWWLGFADATGAPDPNGTYLNRIWYAQDDESTITNADLLFEGKLRFGDTRHTVLAGIDTMRQKTSQRIWADTAATPLDVYNPVYGSFPELDWESLPSDTTTGSIRNVGLLLQDQVKFGERFVLVAGLRRDRADTSGEKDSATSKNLGLVWLQGPVSTYASYSESFEPVSGTGWAPDGETRPRFKPKRGKQIEFGVKWSPSERITSSAAVYQLKEKNRLSNDPAHANESVQLGEVTVKGFEVEANASLAAWDILAAYTYMDARQTAGGSESVASLGKQLESIPRHSASLWLVHRLAALPGLRLGAGLRYAGDNSDGTDGTITPSVTLLDLLVGYETGPWRLALNVNNATDKTYIATCLGRGDCWFGTKRKAQLTVAYRW